MITDREKALAASWLEHFGTDCEVSCSPCGELMVIYTAVMWGEGQLETWAHPPSHTEFRVTDKPMPRYVEREYSLLALCEQAHGFVWEINTKPPETRGEVMLVLIEFMKRQASWEDRIGTGPYDSIVRALVATAAREIELMLGRGWGLACES